MVTNNPPWLKKAFIKLASAMRSSRELAMPKKKKVKEAHLANKIVMKKKHNLKIGVCFHISRCTIIIGRTNPRNESWNASLRYLRTVMEQQRIGNLLHQLLILHMRLIWEIVELLTLACYLLLLPLWLNVRWKDNCFLFVGIF